MLGDVPYTPGEIARLDRVIDEMNAQPLEFVVHVGDIGGSAAACADPWLLERKAQFARIRHPFILLPGVMVKGPHVAGHSVIRVGAVGLS